MAIITYRLDTDAEDQEARLKDLGVPWVQLGDDVLLVASEGQTAALQDRARAARATPAGVVAAGDPADLYLVTQIGRLFQRAHPEVPVRVDRGRYLIVELDPAQAAALAAHPDTCYQVQPLPADHVIFTTRQRPTARVARDNTVQAVVDCLDRAALEVALPHLASFFTRFSTSADYAAAADWARGQLQALGYATRLESLPVGGGTTHNVIAERVGSGPTPRGLLLVTAHLDSINLDDGPAGPAPGADDNGSGSAGVLEMARVLADHAGRHDLQLILFGGEEQGLFGSRHQVARLAPEDRARLRAVVNMDMIGTRNTPAPTVLLEGAELSRPVIDALAAAAATYSDLEIQISLNPFASDHVPFIDAGLPAVLTIEGTDSANPHEHTAGDTLDHISYELMLEILKMNTAFMATELTRPA